MFQVKQIEGKNQIHYFISYNDFVDDDSIAKLLNLSTLEYQKELMHCEGAYRIYSHVRFINFRTEYLAQKALDKILKKYGVLLNV